MIGQMVYRPATTTEADVVHQIFRTIQILVRRAAPCRRLRQTVRRLPNDERRLCVRASHGTVHRPIFHCVLDRANSLSRSCRPTVGTA